MTDRPPTPKLADMLQEFEIDNNKLQKYRDIFIDELKKGCSKETQDSSSLKCYVTYVQDLPDDNVSGKFLALDLGGTNFRVLCVKLAKTYLDMKSKKFALSEAVMRSSGDKLFDHIADCLYQFTTEHKINNDNLPLGFTFSFPCEQRGLEVGILKQWTKGFSCPGVEGKNVVELLRQAIERKKGLTIDVVAVLNDTTGTLMSCAWKKSNAKIGLIIGTGTNACYVEKVENVTKFEGDTTKPIVVINCESGAFGSGGQVDFVRTKWDKDLDAESINPGVNIMEKMISGMYLGEFVRRLLVTAVERQFIFEGVATEKLKKSGSFESKYVSDIEGDLPGQHDHARKVLNTLGYGSPTEQDCVDLHYACFIAWQRAGRMVSAQMAALLNHMDYKDVTIGVDGSLYRFHPGFADLMNKKIRELTDPSIQFKCVVAEDGSGRGAALLAAVATRLAGPRKPKQQKVPTEARYESWMSQGMGRDQSKERLPKKECDEVQRWLEEPGLKDVELPWMDVPSAYTSDKMSGGSTTFELRDDGVVGIRPTNVTLADEGASLSKEGSKVVPEKDKRRKRGIEAESGIMKDIDDTSKNNSGRESRGESQRDSGIESARPTPTREPSISGDAKKSSNLDSIRSSRIMAKDTVYNQNENDKLEPVLLQNVYDARMVSDSAFSTDKEEGAPMKKDVSKTSGSVLSSKMTSSRVLAGDDKENAPKPAPMMSKMISEVSYEPNKEERRGSRTERRRSSSRRSSKDSDRSKHKRRKSDAGSEELSRSGSMRHGRESKGMRSSRTQSKASQTPDDVVSRDPSHEPRAVKSSDASRDPSRKLSKDTGKISGEESGEDPKKAPSRKHKEPIQAVPEEPSRDKSKRFSEDTNMTPKEKSGEDPNKAPSRKRNEPVQAVPEETYRDTSRKLSKDTNMTPEEESGEDPNKAPSRKHKRPIQAVPVEYSRDTSKRFSKDTNRNPEGDSGEDPNKAPTRKRNEPVQAVPEEPSRDKSRKLSKDAYMTPEEESGEDPNKAPSRKRNEPVQAVPEEPSRDKSRKLSKDAYMTPEDESSKDPNKAPSRKHKESIQAVTDEPSRDPSKVTNQGVNKDPSKSISKDRSKASEEPSRDPSKITSQGVSKDPSKSISKDTSRTLSEVASRDPSKSTNREASKGSSATRSEEPSRDPSKGTSKEPSEALSKETSKISSQDPSKTSSKADDADPSLPRSTNADDLGSDKSGHQEKLEPIMSDDNVSSIGRNTYVSKPSKSEDESVAKEKKKKKRERRGSKDSSSGGLSKGSKSSKGSKASKSKDKKEGSDDKENEEKKDKKDKKENEEKKDKKDKKETVKEGDKKDTDKETDKEKVKETERKNEPETDKEDDKKDEKQG